MDTKIKKLSELLESASASLSTCREILSDIVWDTGDEKLIEFTRAATWLNVWKEKSEDSSVIEWVFDWEKMIDPEWFSHPIPVNYISKSKLVEWDWLKLSIANDWKFIYKQIKPVARRYFVWTLTLDDDEYKVIADWKAYKVILAAITYLKANVWDRISIIIPEWKNDVTWAAVDAVVPMQ